MPTARASLAVSAVNGKIYAIGGDSVQCNFDRVMVEEYDPQTDSWSSKTDMPTARTGLTTSAVNGIIYAMGGLNTATGNIVPIVEAYDPATDTWSAKSPMSIERAWFGSSVIDGKIYVFGGTSNNEMLKTVEAYDPGTDTWTPMDDMPNLLGNYFVSTYSGFVYLFGGTQFVGGLPKAESWQYDPVSDTLTSISQIPAARSAGCANEVNGKIYVIGGSNSAWPFQPTSTVYEYTPPVTGVEDPSRGENNPEEFVLHQNYPNPFNPNTTIEFALPKTSLVTLTIYNVTGEKVATLVSENLTAGSYKYQWDAKGLTSGVYFYRLESGEFREAKKLLLLR